MNITDKLAMKICTHCGRYLPTQCFGKDKYASTGLSSKCKRCKYMLTRQWEDRRRSKILKQKCEYYKENCEDIKAYVNERARRPEVKLRNRENSRKWKLSNPDKVRGYAEYRSLFGFNPLNEWFIDSEFHHLHLNEDHSIGLFMPNVLHRSVRHNSKTMKGINEINELAFEWYFKEQLGFIIKGLIN